jgi:hypothetical protein
MKDEWQLTNEFVLGSPIYCDSLRTTELFCAFSRVLPLYLRERPNRDEHLQKFLYCCMLIRCCGNLCWLFIDKETRSVLSRTLGIHVHFFVETYVNFVATLWFPKELYLRCNVFASSFPRDAYMSQNCKWLPSGGKSQKKKHNLIFVVKKCKN